MLKTILLSLLLIVAIYGNETNLPIFNGSYKGILDNREYGGGEGVDETFFLHQLNLELSHDHSQNHRFTGGVFYSKEFGSPSRDDIVSPIIYYRYKSDERSFRFGAFDRSTINTPELIMGYEYRFANPIAEGLYYHRDMDLINYCILVDWIGRKSYQQYETFILINRGEVKLDPINLVWDFLYYHRAAKMADLPEDRGGVIDYGSFYARGETTLGSDLKISPGLYMGFGRERSISDSYSAPLAAVLSASYPVEPFLIKYRYYQRVYNKNSPWITTPVSDLRYREKLFHEITFHYSAIKSESIYIDADISFILLPFGMQNRQELRVNYIF